MLNYTCSWANESEALLPCLTYPKENTALQEQQTGTLHHHVHLSWPAEISFWQAFPVSHASWWDHWNLMCHSEEGRVMVKRPTVCSACFLDNCCLLLLIFAFKAHSPQTTQGHRKIEKNHSTQPSRNLSSLPKEGHDCHFLMKRKCFTSLLLYHLNLCPVQGMAIHLQMVLSQAEDASQSIYGRALMAVPSYVDVVCNLTGSASEDTFWGFVGASASWQQWDLVQGNLVLESNYTSIRDDEASLVTQKAWKRHRSWILGQRRETQLCARNY